MKTDDLKFISWQETHFEVVSAINEARSQGSTAPLLIKEIQEKEGRCGFYELSRQLTNEFEAMNEGREWEGEFFDEVHKFVFEKVYKIKL